MAEKSFLIINVRVVPRASKSEIVGEHNGALKVRVNALPIDGAANAELIKILSKKLNVPNSAVEIISGQTSKHKQVRINGLDEKTYTSLIGS